MTESLKTYHVKVKFMDELRYGQFITAPDQETATQLFLDEYVYIASARDEASGERAVTEIETLRSKNLELQAEVATLKAMYRGASFGGK